MKRTILFILLFAGSLTMFAKQSSYTVYEYRGDVLCKKSGTRTWVAVERNMQLGILDSVAIPEGDYLRIRDEVGDGVYRSVSAGKMRVMDLVVTARKQSRQRVEMQVNDNIKRTMNQQQPTVNVYGTGTREMEEFTDSVAENESSLSRIFNAVMAHKLEPMQTDLSLRKVRFGNLVSFVIDNPTMLGYYFNVMHIDRQKQEMTFCFSFRDESNEMPALFIYPQMTATFHDTWFPESENDIYILVASPDALPARQLGDNIIYQQAE